MCQIFNKYDTNKINIKNHSKIVLPITVGIGTRDSGVDLSTTPRVLLGFRE